LPSASVRKCRSPSSTEFPVTSFPSPSLQSCVSINNKKTLLSNDTADQSVISLADSASNFDDHVGDEFDEVETVEAEDRCASVKELFSRVQFCIFYSVTVLHYPKNLSIPPCPEGIDQSSWTKAFEEATVYLIGTAHFSRESQEDVVRTIAMTQPDLVMVELCPSRISILSMDEQTLLREASDLNTQKILTTVKQSGVVQGILHVLLLSMSAHITRELSMAPGGEFRAAHRAVMQTQVSIFRFSCLKFPPTLHPAFSILVFFFRSDALRERNKQYSEGTISEE
uniref:TraB domain containing n=1 Tax=Heligmosomoides polygyrus TaxID=6339 RepID=A0A183FNR2_HELPZ